MKASDLDYDTNCPVCGGDPTTMPKKRCPPRDAKPRGEPLETCGGTGELPDGSTCPTCGGDGTVYLYRQADLDADGLPHYVNEPFCPSCCQQTTADGDLTPEEQRAIREGYRLKDHHENQGTINRYRDARDGRVRVAEEVVQKGVVSLQEMPERDESTGGFEGRYGDWSPASPEDGHMAGYDQDTVDQLLNRPLGPNQDKYGTLERAEATEMTRTRSDGVEVIDTEKTGKERPAEALDPANFPGGSFPPSPDLTIDEVVAWKKERGDAGDAEMFERIRAEMDAAGVLNQVTTDVEARRA